MIVYEFLTDGEYYWSTSDLHPDELCISFVAEEIDEPEVAAYADRPAEVGDFGYVSNEHIWVRVVEVLHNYQND